MTNKTFSIDIKGQKDVLPSAPRVTSAQWDAKATRTRDAEIELARRLALEQQEKASEEANPTNVRLARIEGQLARQQESIQMLLKLLGKE